MSAALPGIHCWQCGKVSQQPLGLFGPKMVCKSAGRIVGADSGPYRAKVLGKAGVPGKGLQPRRRQNHHSPLLFLAAQGGRPQQWFLSLSRSGSPAHQLSARLCQAGTPVHRHVAGSGNVITCTCHVPLHCWSMAGNIGTCGWLILRPCVAPSMAEASWLAG
ncbi:hypothetical protein DSO57_1010407 [Entomophthora muscae]|uniref:Uncharacterized protein n=1 Tax=Entomophthora muscae TaxID=34485 RepID=A0ACC2RLF0_9FUNG|nr:hypothetical protein DSO57_1010407 [Entomophthora muscae]